MEKYSFFSHKQYDNKVYVVTEHYGPGKAYNFGLVWSRERCAVIDPGLGMFGDLRKYCEALVGYEKAIYAICTSGRPQAVGGVGAFDEAFVDDPDLDLAKSSMGVEARMQVLKDLDLPQEILETVKEIPPVDNSEIDLYGVHDLRTLRSLQSMDHFHLGGVHLEAVRVPGVTPGSVILTVHGDDTINCAFCGRTIKPGANYLTALDRAGFETYRDALTAAIENMKRGCEHPEKPDMSMHLFCSASPEYFRLDVPENLVKAAQDIIDGNTAGDLPADHKGKACKEHIVSNVGIVYDPALL